MKDRLLLTDARQLAALADPRRQRLLTLLVDAPGTVRSLAAQLGEPVTRLYHHVHTLAEAGLIEVVDAARRRGTTERVYRAVARHVALDRALLRASGEAPGNGAALVDAFADVLATALADLQRAAGDGCLGQADRGEDAAVVSYRRLRATPAALRVLRRRLGRWLAAATAVHDPAAAREYGIFVAFYPAPADGVDAAPPRPTGPRAAPRASPPSGARLRPERARGARPPRPERH